MIEQIVGSVALLLLGLLLAFRAAQVQRRSRARRGGLLSADSSNEHEAEVELPDEEESPVEPSRTDTIARLSEILGRRSESWMEDFASGAVEEKERALTELLDYVESEPELRRVMLECHANRSRLLDCYKLLMLTGTGQWAGGHWVLASAFGNPHSLDFILRSADRLPWSRISVLLLEYFERNESGPVPLKLRGPADPNSPLQVLWKLQQIDEMKR